MIRSSVRSAGLAILLTMNGCGGMVAPGTDTRGPSLTVAEAALEGGSGQIALQVSEGVLRRSPNDVHALEIKGDALTLLGDYDQASEIFQALLASDPNSVRANIGLGRIKLSKDPAAAEARFQLVLKRDPNNLTALNNLGIARDLLGRHAEAQAIYRTALALNPDLDSAQVNMALSMAMSGQGPAAVKLLESKANQPGAPAKIRHDYAVVLALAGHRQEAERVLSENMDPQEVAQVLDNVTGTHTRTPPPAAVRIADEAIPPDVVQVPEVPSAPSGRSARAAVPPPAALPAASLAAMGTAPPTVVRPSQPLEETDAPPVTPVSAALTYQRPLSAPLHAEDAPPPADLSKAPNTDPSPVTPKVVAMPESGSAVTPPAGEGAPGNVARVPLPEAPPPAPVLPPVPLPASHVAGTQRGAAVAVAKSRPSLVSTAPDAAASAMEALSSDAAPVGIAPVGIAPMGIAPVGGAPVGVSRLEAPVAAAATQSVGLAMAANVTPMLMPDRPIEPAAPSVERVTAAEPDRAASEAEVQFAATGSEGSARSFWQSLVRRFPNVLGRRSPVVIRYERGGTVFWRVRTDGFETVSQAQTLCAQVRAGGQACFVPKS